MSVTLSPQHARVFGESQCCHSVLRNSRDSFNKLFDFLNLKAVVDNAEEEEELNEEEVQ